MIIYKAQVEKAQVQDEMKKLDSQILKRSGLDKEAKRMLPHYNSLVTKAAELSNTAEKQRRKTSLALLACFVCADLATNAAEQFSDVCDGYVSIARRHENRWQLGFGTKTADYLIYTPYNDKITHWMPLPSVEHLRESTKMIEKGGEE